MRAGLSEGLKRRLRSGDRRAKVIVESVVTAAADQKNTADEWNGADSLTGLDVLDAGAVVLDGAASTDLVDRDLDDQVTALGGIWPQADTYMASLEFDLSSLDSDFILAEIQAELDPNTGGGQEVVQWVCQLFSGVEFEYEIEDQLSSVYPISNRVYVAAGGSVARVTFDFVTTGTAPVRPGMFTAPGIADGTVLGDKLFGKPTAFVAIWGVKADGSPAANTGWRTTAGVGAKYTENGHELRGWETVPSEAPGLSGGVQLTTSDLPNLRAIYTTFSAATITFDTGSPLDLGAVPTGTVEFSILGQEPGGSTLQGQVRNDADSAWVDFVDGDTTDDLAGVGLRQVYEFQVVLTPGTGTTPVLQRVMVRELDRTSLDDMVLVQPKGSLAIDPITLRGEIMEYDITTVRDGRRDYRDFISNLLSTVDLNDLELELYVGHPDLARSEWLLIDTALVDDHQDRLDSVTLNCLSVHRELEQPIPQVKGSGSLTSEPLSYPNTTLKAVWDDVLANQIDLAGRYIGPGIEDTTTNVTNVVEQSTARKVLDELAYIAGGGVIASQGTVQFRSLYPTDPGGIVAIMPKEEVSPQAVTPGARYRTPRVAITYGYDFNENEYTKQYQAEQDNVVGAYGITALQKAKIPDNVGKWVTADATAQTLCERVVEGVGDGLILWALRSTIPYPELEPGDLVAVEVEEFLAKDPNAARAIKGPNLALAVVTAVHDLMGTDFDVWIKSLSDIIPTATEVDRTTLFGGDEGAGPLGLSDFRLAIQGSTFVEYQWTGGALVDSIKVQDQLVTLPASSDPWPGSTDAATSTINSTSAQLYRTAYPDAEQARYITWRPTTAGGVLGPIIRQRLDAPRPPVVDVDFSETNADGTLWMSVKGVGISSVLFATKIGRETQSTFAAATRVGDASTSPPASVVKGGTLGLGQYEQDVTLANNLNSFIRAQLTLYNGDELVYGPFTYDAGNIPGILSAVAANRKVFVTGDTDVKSVLVKRVSGSTSLWEKHLDGFGGEFDLTKVGSGGEAAMLSTEQWSMRAVAFNLAKATASTSSTIANSRTFVDLTVTGESFAGSTVGFQAPRPVAFAPSTAGGANARLWLQATLTSTSFTYKVERRFATGGAPVSYLDVSTSMSPAVGTISTGLSTHSYATIFPRDDASPASVAYDFRCSILNSTGGVVEQVVASASWAYEEE